MNDIEYSQLDSFFNGLANPHKWKDIITHINSSRQGLWEHKSKEWNFDGGFKQAELRDRVQFDLTNTFPHCELGRLLENHFLKTSVFSPITLDELQEIVESQLAGVATAEECSTGINRVFAVAALKTHYHDDGFDPCCDAIPLMPLLHLSHDELESLKPDTIIWKSHLGFWVSICEMSRTFGSGTVIFQPFGRMSTLAMEKLGVELTRVIPILGGILVQIHMDPVLDDETRRCGLLIECDEKAIGDDLCQLERGFFAMMLDWYFAPNQKTSNFDQRMQNAVHMLVEAERQENRAIGFVLCTAAIEAILGDSKAGVTDEISRNVASLLEPNSHRRMDAIVEVKKLYGTRSNVVHGGSPPNTKVEYDRIRAIACAVLYAAYEWRRHTERMQVDLDRNEFLKEVKTISVTGGEFVVSKAKLSRFLYSN